MGLIIKKENIMGTIVVISGYFNPLGRHHLRLIDEAYKLGELWVIVNNDEQVKLKGSCPFQDEKTRLDIMDRIVEVECAILSKDTDESVAKTLDYFMDGVIKRYKGCSSVPEVIFANGGDREHANPKELKVCEERNIKMVFGVGGPKTGSSSYTIEKAAMWYAERYCL